jgi:MrfA Zn-binding domain
MSYYTPLRTSSFANWHSNAVIVPRVCVSASMPLPHGEAPDMAGVLIYTAAPDSDGTLGGLAQLVRPERLRELIEQALERARICASDPLCAEHVPAHDRSLHGAACHACSFVAETSCEIGNRYLDRSVLVSTLAGADLAFFRKA